MKRFQGIVAALLACALLVAACTPAAQAPATSAPKSQTKAEAPKEAAAAKPDSFEAIRAAAEQEGAVVWYESLTEDQGRELLSAFQQRYPFIREAVYVETPGAQKQARLTQESQAGGPTADISFQNAAAAQSLVDQGFTLPVDWEALGVYTSPDMTPTPHLIHLAAPVYGILYNTNLISEAEAPKTFQELLDPKWSGSIGTWSRAEGFVSLVPAWGEETTRNYVRQFAELTPRLYDSTYTIASAVGAGEISLAFTIYHTAQPTVRQGAPVKWQFAEVVPASALYGFLLRHGRNPNAGKLLLHWLASPEGAEKYLEVTDRGNLFLPESTYRQMLEPYQLSLTPVEVAISEADRMNELAGEFGNILQGR